MIPRYSRPKMASLWSAEERYRRWLDIEILVCEALAANGVIPEKALKNIKEKARFDVARVEEVEKTVKHDVIAFLTSVGEYVGEDSRYIHMGLTSSDILDTSLALLLRDAAALLVEDIDRLLSVLKRRALEHKKTVMIGRSHGVHAEPITFGLKMALWYQEMKRNKARVLRAGEVIGYGKLSGAVGTYAFIDPSVESYVCGKLGLKRRRFVPDRSAGQARRVFRPTGGCRRLYREICDGDTAPSEDGGAGSGRVLFTGAEGFLGHAP